FRPSEDPNFSLYNVRVPGRIINGAVVSDRMAVFQGHSGQESLFTLYDAMFRFDPLPDGSVKGVVGGYMTTDGMQRHLSNSGFLGESYFKYKVPSMYYAIRRLADRKLDPMKDEYNGISVVYEMDTVPAFLSPPVKVASNGQ